MGSELFSHDPPRVCSIAGSDSGGGAGIQADLKTIQALGAYGLSVVTALTAQNTLGVQGIHRVAPEFVVQQLRSVMSDIRVHAWKVGMLADDGIIGALGEELRATSSRAALAPLVLDPVMVSTSGSLLLSAHSINALIEELLPLCTLLTPNLPEARQLLSHARSLPSNVQSNGKVPNEDGDSLSSLRSLLDAAAELSRLGPKATLVKGGHQIMKRTQFEQSLAELYQVDAVATSRRHTYEDTLESPPDEALEGAEVASGTLKVSKLPVTVVRTDGQPWAEVLRRCHREGEQPSTHDEDALVVDVLYVSGEAPEYTLFVKPHIESSATHGTGCTLSSAIATYLSSGKSIREATGLGIAYVQAALGRGLTTLGAGHGPLNHSCTLAARGVLAPSGMGSATDRAPFCSRLIARNILDWTSFVQHPFIERLADRTLPRESFVWFLKQDYLFLRHYARVWACGASSASAARTFADISLFAGMAAAMAHEAETHVAVCAKWGITRNELERGTRESSATLAYTRYVLDVARSGDALELLAATGPCLLGYGEAGLWLGKRRKEGAKQAQLSKEDNEAYDEWIDCYAGQEFQDVVRKGIESMEVKAAEEVPSAARVARLQQVWNAAVRLEIGMWDEAVDPTLRREVVDADV